MYPLFLGRMRVRPAHAFKEGSPVCAVLCSVSLPLRAGDSVWPVSSSYSRQRGEIRQCPRPSSPHPGQTEWCAPPDGEGEKTGGGEDSAVAGDVPAAARLFPFLFRVRCTIPQANAVSGRNLPPARAGGDVVQHF